MKTLILFLSVLTIASVSNGQYVNIPDTAFLHALIDEGVDNNGDSLISYAEAEAVTHLNLGDIWTPGNFLNLTGIEAFVNLEGLSCSGELNSLDVSHNTALTGLSCPDNQLTSLDISHNIALTDLWCSGNQLPSLDVSHNTALITLNCCSNHLASLNVSDNKALTHLYCYDNQITSLDVSGCTALRVLGIASSEKLGPLGMGGWNNLTTLDISNNAELEHLSIEGMPTLHEVCVWKLPFPTAGVEVNTTDSPNTYFTTYCSATALNSYEDEMRVSIFPNPSDDIINIELGNPDNAIIEIYTISGSLLYSKATIGATHQIDLSSFEKGLYLIRISNAKYTVTEKIIKVE